MVLRNLTAEYRTFKSVSTSPVLEYSRFAFIQSHRRYKKQCVHVSVRVNF
jgi:hypothetical protein